MRRSDTAVRVSISDTSPIVEGSSAREALHHTVDLARLAESLGYHRYWVAEHHGMRGVAACAPSVVVARLADATAELRVGAGGVLLPHHPPLVIAEQFGTLEAFHPGRIDLALGRAPGGARTVADHLRPDADRTREGFAAQIDELAAYFDDHDGVGPVRALPAPGNRPPIWLLGSGPESAELAAARGLPYAYAHHLNPDSTVECLARYRDRFVASPHLAGPAGLVSVAVIAADSDAHAEWLAGSTRLKTLRRLQGRPIRLPDPTAAAAVPYGLADRIGIDRRTSGLVVGGPDTVRAGLQRIVDDTGAPELMITTPVFDHRERRRSFELVAGIASELIRPTGLAPC